MAKFNKKKILFSKIVSILIFPLIFFFKRCSSYGEGIVVFEWYLLGDLVMISQCIKSLKKKYPDHKITLFCDESWMSIGKMIKGVDKTIGVKCPWSPKHRSYSFKTIWMFYRKIVNNISEPVFILISFRGDIRDHILQGFFSSRLKVGLKYTGGEYMLTHIACSANAHQIELNNAVLKSLELSVGLPTLTIDESNSLLDRDKLDTGGDFIVCNFTSSSGLKNYPIEHVHTLLSYFKMLKIRAYFFHLGELDNLCDKFENIYRSTIEDYIKIVSKAKLFVGVDSASIHIASALRVPSLAIFGPTDENSFSPISGRLEILKASCEYMPCNGRCRFDKAHCMYSVQPESIIFTVIEELGGAWILR